MTRQPQSADDPLWDEEQPDSEPGKAPGTGQEGSWAVSEADRAWAAEVSARGGFLPVLKGPGLTPPASRRRGKKWGNTK